MRKIFPIWIAWCLTGCPLMAGDLFTTSGSLTVQKAAPLNGEPIPVDPGKKYQILFLASATGEQTIEENARVRMVGQKASASRVRVEFLDKAGARVSDSGIGILSQEMRAYARVLYPPGNAACMNLYLEPAKGQQISLEKASVSPALTGREKEAVNPHPTFEFGDLNNYGYQPGFGGGFFQRPDGKTVLNTGFTGQSPSFPVKGNAYYDVRVLGLAPMGRKSSMMIQCFKAQEVKPMKSMRVKISESGETTRLLLPPEAVRADFLFYYVILEELSVMESKKQN
jgi:hypothetical protein